MLRKLRRLLRTEKYVCLGKEHAIREVPDWMVHLQFSLIVEEYPWVFYEALGYFRRPYGAEEEFTSIVIRPQYSKVLWQKQQFEEGDPSPLHSSCKTVSRVLCSVLGSSVQKVYAATGESSAKGHKDDYGTRTSLTWGKAERTGTV